MHQIAYKMARSADQHHVPTYFPSGGFGQQADVGDNDYD